jgi:putative ABC transport system permease protein
MIRFDSIRIALGGIAANRLRSVLTMLGMLIGVAAVIVLVAVGNGSSAAVESSIEKLGTNLLVISPQISFSVNGPAPATSLTTSDVGALEEKGTNPAIAQVAPVVSASSVSMAFNSTSYSPASFVGSTPPYLSMHGYTMAGGSFFTSAQVKSHAKVMVVGQTVVSQLFGGADPIGDNVEVGSGTFEVIGVLAPKGTNGTQDLDDVVMAPYTSVQDQISGYGAFSSIDIEATSSATTTAAQDEATSTLQTANQTTAADPGFNVVNQASLIQTSTATSKVFTTLLGAVAAISLLVGGIGVMNIMLVSVTERTREIGIRKTVGARRSDILSQFLAEAVLLSMLGGLVGVLVGLLGSQFTIDGVKPVIAWYSVGLAFGVSVAVGLFFGLYPASRAAALPPAVALRRD